MPRINNIHRQDRLRERIEQLERGKEVAIREINSLLTKEQQEKVISSWQEHLALRKKNALAKSEYKTIRDIRIEILKDILSEMKLNIVEEFDKLKKQREVKAAKVFLDSYFEAKDNGKNALSKANIELQRNHFKTISKLK
jgi:hypothetical protein